MDVSENEPTTYRGGDAQEQFPVSSGFQTSGRRWSQHGWRRRQAQEGKEVRLRYASWNVGTMTGRERELAAVLKKRRINVACLQETKWKGTRAREIGEGYKFYYCGSDGKRNGVGIVLDCDMKLCVTDVKRMNDRIIAVKLIWEGINVNVMSVYAPQSGCNDEVKDKFWEDFDSIMMGIPESEEIYIGGDFNGHVGVANHDYESVHGGWGYGTRNSDGETLLQTATALQLALVNTYFQKKDEHLITYKSGHHATQIDYFLIRKRMSIYVKDCKVLPGECLVAQHRLLLMEIKIKIKHRQARDRPPPRTKWRLLEREECADKFKDKVVDKMIEMNDMNGVSVNECWKIMACYIRKVAKEVCGETRGKGIIERDTWWWSEDVQTVIKEKKKAFKEWQNENEDESVKEAKKDIYEGWKKKTRKAVAMAKHKAREIIYNSLDGPRGQKELYRITKTRQEKIRDINHVRCIKDNAGMVLSNDDEIKNRWKAYFEKLMNEENVWNGILKEELVNVGLVNEINMDEVRSAVRNMKNGKAVGPDDIPVEVWKILSEDGCKWLTLFFNKLLQEETIPQEWYHSTIVPIFKNKGDVQDCNNYRGIKLISHTMKVWEKVIEQRLRGESEISQNQFGFMPGRGTTDAIFVLRQLCEKYRIAHKNLNMVFVDLEKAYDRVPRTVLWWALKEKGVPVKYVRLIRTMYERTCTYVRSAVGNTDEFSVAVGLHQGSALSPYLFLLVMDALSLPIEEEAPWCMLFADDIVLVGEDGPKVQSRLETWRRKLEGVGLKISRTKTEHMFCDFGGPSNFTPIRLDSAPVPVCSDFRYLGSLLQKNGDIDRTVKHRINAGWMKWRQVTGTTCDPQIPLKFKGKIYKTLIRPALLYGSSCLAMKATDERKIHVAEMRMLRWMCGVTRIDKIRNEYIRGSLKVAPVVEKLRSARLAWYGHVMRRDERNVLRRVLSMNVEGMKSRGRPKKRWMDCVKDDMARKDVSIEMTNDRKIWKDKTYYADPK